MKLAIVLAVAFVSILIYLTWPSGDSPTSSKPCRPKKFNGDSIVCVCDETYCDSQQPIQRLDRGNVQVFESSRSGKRLDQRLLKFKNILEGSNFRNVVLDRKEIFQEIIGFGGAWSDSAGIGIGRMSEKLKTSILKDYFSEGGIEYSIGRTVISGCDFSTRPYSYDDTPDDWDLTHWSLAEEDILYKIPQMKEAQAMSKIPIKFMASSWSPPAWLKTNNKINGGTLKEVPGSRTWKTYARYLLKFFETYKTNGIKWWGMTVQNEPMAGWDPEFPWNALGFNATMERDFTKTDLGPIFEEAGYTKDSFNILGLDYNRPSANAWADIVFGDKGSSSFIKGLGLHWYTYGGDAGPYTVLDTLHAKYPDKLLLATEACNRDEENEEDRTGLGKWVLGEEYAHDIILNLLHSVQGWVDWNLVLDTHGGPNWANNFFSAPIIVNPEAGEYYKNTQFYAMAHFSKFLPPGTVRIGSTTVEEERLLEVGAFVRPDGGTVIIAINSKDEDEYFNLVDPEYSAEFKVKVEAHSFSTWIYH